MRELLFLCYYYSCSNFKTCLEYQYSGKILVEDSSTKRDILVHGKDVHRSRSPKLQEPS